MKTLHITVKPPLPTMPQPRMALTDANFLAEVQLTQLKTSQGSRVFLSP